MADDIGWKPAVDSWIESLECAEYRPLLAALFAKYVEPSLEQCRRAFKTVVPLPAINQVNTLCKVGGQEGSWSWSCAGQATRSVHASASHSQPGS